ncbi:hemolysin XhlA family protein [Thalassovita sp.]|uniref:hemolysin XhlA family protein n=1 Tax=Thalassovita sp. TaxID=1979401 RepID=UPI002B276D13|nr:hemolysin XhlA family protein [Thalassovita sp.]
MTDVPPHVNESLQRAHVRLDRHDNRLTDLEVANAGMAQWRLSTTEKLNGIQSGIKWVIGLILAGFIGAVVQFVISGGLNGAP